MRRPLADVNVLEFSTAVAGPYAGQLLSDWGADVLKVEPPDGAEERKTARHVHHMLNRGKRSLSVDLTTDEGQSLVRGLVDDHVDVLLVNYRPGVMERFGLDYETLRAENDALVYCSLSGFGDTGPYSDRPAMDPIAQAMSGIMVMTGEPDRKPARIGGSLIDMGAATNAVLGVAMALLQQATTGVGQKVESSLLETAASWGGEWGAYYTLNDEVPQRMGSKKASYAPVGAYETADGLVYVAAFGNPTFERLCRALELEELVEDDRFADAADRRRNRAALDDRLEAATRTYDRAMLVDRLLDHGVPAARIYEVAEVIEDPHLDHREMFLDMESEEGTDMVVPATPITLSGSARLDSTDLPAVGEDSAAVAQSLGYDDSQVEALLDSGVIRSS